MQRPATILIADDLVSTRELLRDMLGGQGYAILLAAGGAEAVALARSHTPDLVLLDLMMPDLDGLQVCRMLRADPKTAKIPVLIITALDDRRSRFAGIESGCDDFLTKPVDMIELRARVQTITTLNRYRLLLDEQRRFERLFELAPAGLLIADGDGTIRLANPALAQLLGVPDPAAIVGLPLAELLAPEDGARGGVWLASVAAERMGAARLSALLARRDGERRPVELDAGWFEWSGEAAVQVVIRDVSDRARAALLEEDNRRLALDLHDAVAQTATAAFRQLERFRHRYRPRRAEAQADLDRAIDLVRELMHETRALLAGLRPAALDDLGLAGALRLHGAALANNGLMVELHEELGPRRLPPPLETALYRIAQEALTNVRKHAGTSSARLQLTLDGATLRLQVADEGCGLPAHQGPCPAGSCMGIRGMHERAALIGGRLTIASGPTGGTRITAEVPLPPAQEPRDG